MKTYVWRVCIVCIAHSIVWLNGVHFCTRNRFWNQILNEQSGPQFCIMDWLTVSCVAQSSLVVLVHLHKFVAHLERPNIFLCFWWFPFPFLRFKRDTFEFLENDSLNVIQIPTPGMMLSRVFCFQGEYFTLWFFAPVPFCSGSGVLCPATGK